MTNTLLSEGALLQKMKIYKKLNTSRRNIRSQECNMTADKESYSRLRRSQECDRTSDKESHSDSGGCTDDSGNESEDNTSTSKRQETKQKPNSAKVAPKKIRKKIKNKMTMREVTEYCDDPENTNVQDKL